MNKLKWKKRIISSMTENGLYQSSFDDVIETLAGILERRDELEKDIKENNEPTIVEHINKSGNSNMEQNPKIRLLNDMNRDALTFWRDLGLTPKGLKSIKDVVISDQKESPLDEVMRKLGRELN